MAHTRGSCPNVTVQPTRDQIGRPRSTSNGGSIDLWQVGTTVWQVAVPVWQVGTPVKKKYWTSAQIAFESM